MAKFPFRCIACGKGLKSSRWVYCDEALCRSCWDQGTWYDRRNFLSANRELARQRKREIMMDKLPRTYPFINQRLAVSWAHLRRVLGVKPEFPAGLRSFLVEMFDGRDQEPL